MADNVRCTGRPLYGLDDGSGALQVGCAEPCGWTGERYALGTLDPKAIETTPYGTPAWFDAVRVADERARTRKPCPRCRGRVELIGDPKETP